LWSQASGAQMVIVPEGGHNIVAVDMIVTKIRSVIEE
jgi:hypothetical protein